ncbi:ATP-binding protein [Streptomyces milbemycinicus]|uniref:ATP-binding protein n=1 Tax=Streptomyces milbemycinicus TaxID=476552 RepID=UPI0021F8D44A|nr:tetratricopeptide repeat protein [Streptomyces bingchenggensis]
MHFHAQGKPYQGSSASPTPRQLPADVRGFVNRTDELGELNAVLTSEDGGPLVVSVYVIAGTAGAGKTSLALRWAHQVRERFPDGQLYANLRGYDPGEPVAARDALHRFLTSLGVPADAVPQDLDAAAALYRSLLADRRVLVVLDNAATLSQVRPLLPGSAHSLVLVTSRSRLSGLAVRDGARRLTLGVLPEAEAVALLRAVTAGYRPVDDERQLAELARLCARLPLALRIAAERAASHPHLRLVDLIADLRDESALWDALSTGDDEEAEAVRTVFAWSYRALSEQAARLFRLLGLHPGPEFGLHAAAALAGVTSSSRTRQLLDSLVGAHLLEQTAPDRYQFHDLLRAYAIDQAQHEEPPAEREAALHRALEWSLHTADAAQSWINPAEDRLTLTPAPGDVSPLTFSDYDAAVDWAEREHANLLQAVRRAADAGQDRLAWQLSAVLWNAQFPSVSGASWPAAGRIGLEAAERLGERAAQGVLLTWLGMAHTRINRLAESLECHENALIIRRGLGDRLGEARSLNLIGLNHLRGRRLDTAARHFEQAIAGFQEQDAAHWAATALSNLATTHYRAGRLPEAATVIDQSLAAHRALSDQRGEGSILRVLSDVRREQGDTEEALVFAQAAVDIALGLRNLRLEGFWLLTLGDAQQAKGQFAEALTSYQRSATLHRRREALAWQGVGEVYCRLGRHAEAAGFYRQAASTHRELRDEWHQALALDGLGSAVLGESPEEARRHWTQALRFLADFDDPRAVAAREDIERQMTEVS